MGGGGDHESPPPLLCLKTSKYHKQGSAPDTLVNLFDALGHCSWVSCPTHLHSRKLPAPKQGCP